MEATRQRRILGPKTDYTNVGGRTRTTTVVYHEATHTKAVNHVLPGEFLSAAILPHESVLVNWEASLTTYHVVGRSKTVHNYRRNWN